METHSTQKSVLLAMTAKISCNPPRFVGEHHSPEGWAKAKAKSKSILPSGSEFARPMGRLMGALVSREQLAGSMTAFAQTENSSIDCYGTKTTMRQQLISFV
jgi:hypothetical protein